MRAACPGPTWYSQMTQHLPIPSQSSEGSAARAHLTASGQLDYILDAWSRNEGATLLQGALPSLENYRSAFPPTSPAQIRAHEDWRMAYRAERYLATVGIDELMTHGRVVFAQLAPHFLIGAAKHGDLSDLLQRWTHFLEECELRNLDMRQFSPDLPATQARGHWERHDRK